MNANDARIARVYTTQTNQDITDESPNAGNPPKADFGLTIEAEAGTSIGNSGASYTLCIIAYDVTAGNNEPAMNPFGPTGCTTQNFTVPGTWRQEGDDFSTDQSFTINVPPNVQNHVFYYTASLVSTNHEIVSIRQSDPFVLV
jgi:hypothetical protein